MAANDYNLDVETQRRIEYTRQKVLRIDQISEQVRKLTRANRNSEEKLERLIKRKESLEMDIARLTDSSARNVEAPEVGIELLNSIEEPMEMDMIYGEAFRKKMCHLKVLLNDIIVRTSFNEKAMCKEIGHQEGEFENRLKEAIHGRNVISRKVQEAKDKCEGLIREQANIYEDVRELEENIEKFDASRWLLNVEKRRLSDILDRTKREPKCGIDPRKPYIIPSESSSIEELVTTTASLTHEHYEPSEDHFSVVDPLTNPPNSLAELEHKEGCPKRKMHVIPHSKSLVSQVKKDCPVHGKAKKEVMGQLSINGVNLMELISKEIEKELSSL